jgi:fructokinase
MGNVLCPGELLIDFVSLDDGKKLSDVKSFLKKSGGAPANTVMAVNKFGAEAFFVGAVGNDAFGDFLINVLDTNKISSEYVKRSNENTTLAFISLDENGERSFEFVRGADKDLSKKEISQELLKKCNIFHFGSATAFLGADLQESYYFLLDYAVKNNKIVSFDPNYREALFGDKQELFIKNSLKYVAKSHILKVSDEEARLLTGKDNLDIAISKLLKIGAKNIFVTIGNKGTIYATSEKKEVIESIKVNVIDTTGAGDAFVGALLGQLSNFKIEDLFFTKLREFVKIANITAALTITKKGALESIPNKAEVMKHIH